MERHWVTRLLEAASELSTLGTEGARAAVASCPGQQWGDLAASVPTWGGKCHNSKLSADRWEGAKDLGKATLSPSLRLTYFLLPNTLAFCFCLRWSP